MTRINRTQPMSPAEAAALIRHRQWEVEAEKARDRSWFTMKRFDVLDLFLMVGFVFCATMVILALI